MFTLAGITDGLDGWIAKRYQLESALGAMLDPIADTLTLVLPGSDKPLLIKVKAKGYEPFTKALIPDRDRTVEVLMAEKASDKPAAAKKPAN